MSCKRAQEFLAAAGIQAEREVNAKKEPHGEADALAQIKGMSDLYVAKGKKVVHVNLGKSTPDREGLAKLLLGPTGKLRAPTLRVGKTLIVGFDRDTYQQIFG